MEPSLPEDLSKACNALEENNSKGLRTKYC